MDKESAFELQKIDCNCNDCKFMARDFDTFKKWEEWNKSIQAKDFEERRKSAFKIASECSDEKGRQSLLTIANKMKFEFDKGGLLHYGHCQKFNKQVCFIPATCQIETQECFVHRRLDNN